MPSLRAKVSEIRYAINRTNKCKNRYFKCLFFNCLGVFDCIFLFFFFLALKTRKKSCFRADELQVIENQRVPQYKCTFFECAIECCAVLMTQHTGFVLFNALKFKRIRLTAQKHKIFRVLYTYACVHTKLAFCTSYFAPLNR